MVDTYDPKHVHEPEVAPQHDDEGRCLVCVLMCRMDEKASLRIAAARREGVIEGLERALEFSNSSVDRMDIRAEIERLRGEKL